MLAVICGGVALPAVAQPAANKARSVAVEVHRAGGYPDKLAIHVPEVEKNKWDLDWLNWNFGGLGEVVTYVVVAVLVAALVAFLVLIIMRLRPKAVTLPKRRSKAVRAKGVARVDVPIDVLANDPWLVDGDPDALAAAGEFERAMGALLLRALRASGWGEHGTDRSVTAREVVVGLSASDPRRGLLGLVVSQAELVRFGGRPATAEGFAAMRANVEAIFAARRAA